MTSHSVSLNRHLYESGKVDDELRHVILAIARAATYIQYAIRTTESGLAGTKNIYGEEQIKLDVLSDDIIREQLMDSLVVGCFASEEQKDIIELRKDAPYSVVFDPLDGSSLVDVNFAIGSIFGIYKGKTFIGSTPRDQVAAVYVLYGPRTLLLYSTGNGVHQFLLNDVGEFVLQREFLGIGDVPKNYSPGNLRVLDKNAGYGELLRKWMEEKLTLRYSGCMVADVHHIVSKGQGIFVNVGEPGGHGKLRLVFECGPFSYLIEQAGGKASDGEKSVLDIVIESIDQKTSFIAGSSRAVDEACEILRP